MEYYLYACMALACAIFVAVPLIQEFGKKQKTTVNENAFRDLSIWVIFFCVQDALWGLAASDLIRSRFFLIAASFVFHLSATFTAYCWVKFLVSYHAPSDTRRKWFTGLSLGVVALEAVLLIVNFFYPVIFSVDSDALYHTEGLRVASFFLQYAIYAIIGVVEFLSWIRSAGAQKNKYLIKLIFVAAPCICGIFQAMFSDAPFYSIGYAIGCCVIHTFLISGERRELLNIRAKDLEEIVEKQTADLRIAKEKAESASNAKTVFLNSMSHDIRTPMNAIIGFTEIATKNIDDKQKLSDSLQKISRASGHLLSLINDVLDMSRVESGTIILHAERTNIHAMLDQLFSILNASAQAKNIGFSYTVDPSVTHDWIHLDIHRTMRILTNIVSNSIKYTDIGGKVELLTEELPCEKDGYARIRFTVSDTGMGMSKDFVDRIFEPFSRAKSVTESGIEGTGLGMPIVKSLLELMGGSISVESELGVGTTVRIEIDCKIAEEAVSDLKAREGIINSVQGISVLLVDDNEMNREIATDILQSIGIKVNVAEDGDIAVEKVKNSLPGQFDLVFMDIQMPRMNGYDATRAIREFNKDIPIIAMTANAFEEDRQNALAAGMNAHVAKPIDAKKLTELIGKTIGK